MKLGSGLAGIGAAMVFILAAQTAEASTRQCPGGEGGGEHQIELPPEGVDPCLPSGGYVELNTTVYTGTNVAYNVEVDIENGNDYLQIGEVIEVEIEFDDVIASLKANEKDAVVLAAAIGVRPNAAGSKSGVVNAANTMAGSADKLTEAEFEAVANYVYVSMQSGGRATGRSDPASNSFTSRVQATAQAIGRAWNSFTSSLPNRFDGWLSHTTYYPNGAKKSEFVIGARAAREE